MASTESAAPETKETGRLEAFSDGVFGIAMTLLVIDLKVPDLPADGVVSSHWLWAQLGHAWPSYFAFASSFLTILIMWIHHHALLKMVRVSDAAMLFANGGLLFFVTATPFTTGVLARYLMTPAAQAAAILYGGCFVLIGTFYTILLLAALRPKVRLSSVSEELVAQFCGGYRLGAPIYLLATLSALYSAWLCLGICTALMFFWAAMTPKIARTEL